VAESHSSKGGKFEETKRNNETQYSTLTHGRTYAFRQVAQASSSERWRPIISACICIFLTYKKGTAVAQWLRCCATDRKVAGSIPAGIMDFSLTSNPSDRTIVLGSTQPVTEMSTRSISWG